MRNPWKVKLNQFNKKNFGLTEMRVVCILLFFLTIVQTGQSQEFQENGRKPTPVEGSCKDVLEYIKTYIEVNDSLSVVHFKKYYVITTPVSYGFRKVYDGNNPSELIRYFSENTEMKCQMETLYDRHKYDLLP